MDRLELLFEEFGRFMSSRFGEVLGTFTFLSRFIIPLLALIVLVRCILSLFSERSEQEEWGFISVANGAHIPITHWENTIGRSRSCDICLPFPTVSRSHAALIRDDSGVWRVYDHGSKTGVKVNGKAIKEAKIVGMGDIIDVGGIQIVFSPMDKSGERLQAEKRSKPGKNIKPAATLVFLTALQLVLCMQLCISQGASLSLRTPVAFAALILLSWLFYAATRAIRRRAFEIETIALMLSTFGLEVTVSSVPSDQIKQIAFLFAGIALYFIVGVFLRNLDTAKKLRWPIAAVGLILLAVNLVLSEAVFGAKNWLSIGGVSFQPSELVKIAFVFAGAATLDRLMARRNLIMFIAFAGACVGALALMSDFGTAVVFFTAYLIIAFMRSGSFATVFLSVGGAAFAGFLAITAKPYIKDRFTSWGKAWQFPYDAGYQQTRTMSAAASGGLFGVGAGNGWLQEIVAANTDMVFGMICEELGLVTALILIACIVVFAVYVIQYAGTTRSSFYVIAAAAAVTMMMTQMILNVLGCVDILPFTGVTFPFVSKGGSSLISCWGLLAFIKSCDMRQNASFTVKMPKKSRSPGAQSGGKAEAM